jgi:hypothetical protein
MDCVYAEVNRIYELPRDRFEDSNPRPDVMAEVPGSVYYAAAWSAAGEHWVAFSTAMEAGRDRTGPTQQSSGDGRGVVVVASSLSAYEDWQEIESFRRRRVLFDHLPGGLPRANGYVFLAASPEMGLLTNPYNTADAHGTIHQYSPERFE